MVAYFQADLSDTSASPAHPNRKGPTFNSWRDLRAPGKKLSQIRTHNNAYNSSRSSTNHLSLSLSLSLSLPPLVIE